MSEEHLQRIAKLEVITANQDREFEAMRRDLQEIKAAVTAINLVLAERRGGARYLMVLLSASALLGGMITQIANWLKLI